MSFDSNDIEKLHTKLVGINKPAFINKNTKNFVGSIYAGKIKFTSSGDKPHQTSWIKLKEIINNIFPNKNWPELATIDKILSDPLLNPSTVRNNWNYKRADYFGMTGENINTQFKKLITNPSSAVKWLERNNQSTNSDDGCRIIALCEVLAPAVIDARNRLVKFTV